MAAISKEFSLKPTHKVIAAYYDDLRQLDLLGATSEGSVRGAFLKVLAHCARQCKLALIEEYTLKVSGGNSVRFDAVVVDEFSKALHHGYWEAKDEDDDLKAEVVKKFKKGYPAKNILFQSPRRAVLYQNGEFVADYDLRDPAKLADVLRAFFNFEQPEFGQWERAVAEFKERVPEIAAGLRERIAKERTDNKRFRESFEAFAELCRQSINPNIAPAAVEEMLIQHLLTKRLFGSVFDNAEFVRRNAIAAEIEKVIAVLMSAHFDEKDFLGQLDRFYKAIEAAAATAAGWSEKQQFLNTIYEQFFQGFSVKVADTHGIVYTPQPIVDFMVRSVEEILVKEFGRSLDDTGVHILDPFVGTGNFIVRVMREIAAKKKSALPQKYADELFCNEIMLLPYYIASMNIEHEYFDMVGKYQPFEGVCLVDTFELAEPKQTGLFATENVARVNRQKEAPIFVVISNPPYNMGQVNENDNNKNRKYETVDDWVRDTYVKDSSATLRNKLSDPYVKAIRWASNRIGKDGIVAFVTNNSFIDAIAFDGMRRHLQQDFTSIYVLNLKGNARTSGERRRREAGNVFDDMIRVGVSITFMVRKTGKSKKSADIHIWSVDDYVRSGEKKKQLEAFRSHSGVPYKKVVPDAKNTWLTEGMAKEWPDLIPLTGPGEVKVFERVSCGVVTARDSYVYSFDRQSLAERAKVFVDVYERTVALAESSLRKGEVPDWDKLIDVTDARIKWSRQVKASLQKCRHASYDPDLLVKSLYRPYTDEFLYFDDFWNEERYQLPKIFPPKAKDSANACICVSGPGNSKPFHTLVASDIPCFDLIEKTQCFPFYTYDEDGGNRRENITDWALKEFRERYKDKKIGKWDIFHYVYGLLHHPHYRTRYAANLRRELPRVPYAPDFWAFAKAGQRLAELHVGYESQKEYKLERIEDKEAKLSYRVERMKLSKDKTEVRYNDFLTLRGIPAEAHEYRLGNRSALEWVIDQYQVSTDKRSGITNDPNNLDDEQYILRLIGQVTTVSVETVKIVQTLQSLDIGGK